MILPCGNTILRTIHIYESLSILKDTSHDKDNNKSINTCQKQKGYNDYLDSIINSNRITFLIHFEKDNIDNNNNTAIIYNLNHEQCIDEYCIKVDKI